MSDDWLEVSVSGARASAELLESWLFDAGALSVTLSDSVDDEELHHAVLEPIPGEVRLWEDVTLVGLFDQGSTKEQVHDALRLSATKSGNVLPSYRVKRLQDQVWERTWMDTFKPMRFGHRLWICPTQSEPVDANAITLRLDPGMAFGTGTHATTAQCLQWLGEQTDVSLQPMAGKSIIDYGCGSGVLSIAALLLGAKHAWAVDIDPQALQATTANSALNSVQDRITIGQPDILSDVTADVVMANILFQPLMGLADTLSQQVVSGGALIMSGILETQMRTLRMRYNDNFQFAADRACDGWALLTAERR